MWWSNCYEGSQLSCLPPGWCMFQLLYLYRSVRICLNVLSVFQNRFTFFSTKRWLLLWKSTVFIARESFLAFMRMWGYYAILTTFLPGFTCGMHFPKAWLFVSGFMKKLYFFDQQVSIILQFCGSLYVLMIIYRSHHEKLVIVDNHVCFIGGLDLCFGRYDTSEHVVGDSPPLIWPGKDYYNPR